MSRHPYRVVVVLAEVYASIGKLKFWDHSSHLDVNKRGTGIPLVGSKPAAFRSAYQHNRASVIDRVFPTETISTCQLITVNCSVQATQKL